MRYFKFKKVVLPSPEDTTLGIVTSEGESTYFYDEIDGFQYVGVATTDENFLNKQHSACLVEELTFEEIAPILKSCQMYKDINNIVTAKIRQRYSVDDEMKLNRIANSVAKTQTPQEFWDYNTYVEECKAYGDSLKIQAGLKQQA
jgi:hypothetical protein